MSWLAETAPGAVVAGFADPVADSQRLFRALLTAMAHPGRIEPLPVHLPEPQPSALWPTTVALALALLDADTPLWCDRRAPFSDSGDLDAFLAFHCGCPRVDQPEDAQFGLILVPQDVPPLARFPIGTSEYPDRSATLLVQVSALENSAGVWLRGPGVETEACLLVPGLPGAWWTFLSTNAAAFPLGVDVVFAASDRLAALPRSVSIALDGCG